jgi:Ca2+-binding EF-hand superfamily protein
MDQDKNGVVSKEEFMQFMEAEFDRLDVDKSGGLSAEELSHSRIYEGTHTNPHR